MCRKNEAKVAVVLYFPVHDNGIRIEGARVNGTFLLLDVWWRYSPQSQEYFIAGPLYSPASKILVSGLCIRPMVILENPLPSGSPAVLNHHGL